MLATMAGASSAGAAETASPWRLLTQADVAAACENVQGIHPGMRDPLTPGFAAATQAACERATAEAAQADSYADWRETLLALITSFRDGHLNLSMAVEPVRVRWPGFLIDGRSDGYVVRYPAGLPVADNAPPEGARFMGCDGVAAEDLLQSRLDGRSADLSKAPERLRQAYRLFVDYGAGPAPFARCAFQTAAGEQAVDMAWKDVSLTALNPALAPFTRRVTRPIGMEWLSDGGVWIALGNVRDEGRLKTLEAEMMAAQSRLRAAPYVVFDVRGGAGGNSMWGGKLASILWGAEAVEGRRLAAQSDTPGDFGKFWRASPEAARAIRAVGDEFAAQGPDMADVAAFWRALADEIEARPEGDVGLLMDGCCRPKPRPQTVPPVAYAGQAFVVTDAGTFSSSILVMNTLKRMGAVQVGEPSGQNEVYGESIGPILLPSGLGSYRVPVSIIRQPRSQLGGLAPDVAWPGAMDDEAGIRAWVADLAKRP